MIFIFISLASFVLVYFTLHDKRLAPALVVNFLRLSIKFSLNDFIIFAFFIEISFYIFFGNPGFVLENLSDVFLANTQSSQHNLINDADLALKAHDYKTAIALYEKLLVNQPSNIDFELNLAEAYIANNNGIINEQAEVQIKQAYAIDSKNIRANFFLGFLLKQTGQNNQARVVWTKLLNSLPDNDKLKTMLQQQIDQLQ